MYKILNTLMILIIIFFTFTIYKYYSSNKNIKNRDYIRLNIDEILKLSNLPVLSNDTNDVIEFNNSFENEINNEKKRSFWDLLKNK